MSHFLSRKFLAAMAAFLGAHWALMEKLIEGADYKALVLGTLGAYIVGNVGQKAVEAKKEASQ